MNKFFKVLLPALVLSLTSCFDIIEEVTINNDGSGTYTTTIDMSSVIGLMKMMGDDTASAKETNESMEEISDNFKEHLENLRAVAGITNPAVSLDEETGIYSMSYNFASVDALNKAIKTTAESKEGKNNEATFKFNGKKFERVGIMNNKLSEDEQEDEEADEDMDDSMKGMMSMMFEDHYFTTIVHFEGKVKKVKSDNAKVSEDKKTITNKVSLIDLLEDKEKIAFKAKIKK